MCDPKMPLQDLLVMGRQLKCSNVQARHNEEDKHELQDEDTRINLIKVKASTNTCRYCSGEWPHIQEHRPAKGKHNVETTIVSSSTVLPNYDDV